MESAKEFIKYQELNEDDLKHIKSWLTKQPHLPQNIKDEKIILIMHKCHYNLERSKKFLDSYYTLRTHLPEFFSNRDIHKPETKETFDVCHAFAFEGRTKQGYKVVYMGLNVSDSKCFNFSEGYRMLNMVVDATIELEGTVPGFLFILDMRLMNVGHLTKLSLPAMKKMMMYTQDGALCRIKGVHMINAVPFIDKVLAIAKPFMSSELTKKIKIHSEESDTIYEYVPQEMFPNEFGGKAGTLESLREKSVKLMENFQTWYKEDELMRVNEAKRPGKAMSPGDLFGLDGSFKKLTID